jgi:hypothetical protein
MKKLLILALLLVLLSGCWLSNPMEWSPSANYSMGALALVTNGGTYTYRSLMYGNVDNFPPDHPGWWEFVQ